MNNWNILCEDIYRGKFNSISGFRRKLFRHLRDVRRYIKGKRIPLPKHRCFLLTRWRPSAIMDFKNLEILLADGVQSVWCITVPQFVEIGQSVEEISRFLEFSRWRPSAILALLCACLDPKKNSWWSLSMCKIYLASVFRGMVFRACFWFHEFGFKMLIHDPKIVLGEGFDPLNGERCQRNLQKVHPCGVRVVWAIMRKKPSTGLACSWVPKKGCV